MPSQKTKGTKASANVSEASRTTTRVRKSTKSVRAGLKFPVGRIHRILKDGHYSPRVGMGSAVYLTAVLEYLACEILELAGDAATDNKRTRISPRHILLAIKKDAELCRLLKGATISQGGYIPSIQTAMISTKSEPNNYISSQEY